MPVPANRFRNFFASLIIVVIVGFLLSLSAFLTVWQWGIEELNTSFHHDAENRYAALEREIQSNVEALLSLKAFFLHAEKISRSDFDIYTRNLLLHYPGIKALEWIPHVPVDRRSEYEQAAKREGFSDFLITERNNQGKMAGAGWRNEYFPVYFVAPYEGNEIALGFDLGSDPTRKKSLELARDTGKLAASAGITLVQETADQFGFLVNAPIYKKGAPADSIQDRRENLKGFVLGVFRIGDIVEKSMAYLSPSGIDLCLYDISGSKESFLYYHPSRLRKNVLQEGETNKHDRGLRYARKLDVVDRKWLVVCTPAPVYPAARKSLQPWGILLGGFMLTGLLTSYLWVSNRRAGRLAATYERLLHETEERRKTEEELRESEERFRSIFEDGPVGMIIAGEDYRILRCNRAFCAMIGYAEEELMGKEIVSITHPEDREDGRRHSQALMQGEISHIHLEKRYLRKDGKILWGNLTATALEGKDGKKYGLGIVEDITTHKEAAEQIHLLSYYDGITKLPNRTFFRELMKRALFYAQRHKKIMALLIIDLDNFKRINDSLGHGMGDRLLHAVGERLSKSMRLSDYVSRHSETDMTEVVSRLGGDEFAIMLHTIGTAQDAGIAARRILKKISEPFPLNEQEIFMTACIGISLFPDDGEDADTLIKNADKAMQEGKTAGRSNYQYYSKSMNVDTLENLNLEIGLHKALERDEFILFYQPKFDAQKRKISGLEALIRWKNSGAGLISPSRFIHLAEETGLIVPIGAWALRTACMQNKTWQDAGFAPLCISVNLSSRQFDQKDLLDVLTGILKETKLSPAYLELEITESTIMRNPEEAIKTLHKLRETGIKIAVDDFGTGYSSLSYLRRIPLDYLKIDRSFITNIISNRNDAALVKAIIAMAHSLDLKVVAEGVETDEQLSFLCDHGCDEVQGFLLSRPLPGEEITDLLINIANY